MTEHTHTQLINNVVFLVYSKVIQLYKSMYLFSFKFFPHLGGYIVLKRIGGYIVLKRVLCATEQALTG